MQDAFSCYNIMKKYMFHAILSKDMTTPEFLTYYFHSELLGPSGGWYVVHATLPADIPTKAIALPAIQ